MDEEGKTFCICKLEWESRNTGDQAGHLGPVNPHPALLLLSTPGPAIPIACSNTISGGASSREAGETVSQNMHWQTIHPPSLPQNLFPSAHCLHLGANSSNSWSKCKWTHPPRAQNRKSVHWHGHQHLSTNKLRQAHREQVGRMKKLLSDHGEQKQK